MKQDIPHPWRTDRPWRALVALVAMLATVSAALVTLERPASAATIDTDAYYVLENRHSGKVMDVWEWSTEDGGEIVQWARTDAANQQFRFVDTGDGYYVLENRHSGKAIDVWEGSTEDGAEIRQYTNNAGTNQQFQVVDSADGHIRLINRNSGKALEVWEWSTEDGARLSQYTDLDGANQQWRLVEVDSDGGGGGQQECGGGEYHAEAVAEGGGWTARNGGQVLYSGNDMLVAMRAAVESLSPGRSAKEWVVVRGSGSMSASASLDLPSHTGLAVCGTINVTGSPAGDNAVVRARNATNIEVSHLSVTGAPYFGIFVRNGSDIALGQIDLRLSGGLGIRIDNHADRATPTTDVAIEEVYVSGTNNHGVETYGVDGLRIGTVVARDTAYSGLLLNDTTNAQVGLVDAVGAGTGTGYAAFRMANRNGRIGNGYPTNIYVGEVIARGGGRGIFCVSESGGAVIDRVDIAQTGGNAMLIENCHNVTIAAQGGSVAGPGDIRIAARSEFANTSDVTIANLTVTDSALTENPCGNNITFRNNTLVNSADNTC